MQNKYLYNTFDDQIYIEYDPLSNQFYDQCGFHISNIYELVTPNDLCLFRKIPSKYYLFRHRSMKNVLCQIIMNGVEIADENYFSSSCHFAAGSRCWFSDNEKAAREEICRDCRGGNI